MHWMPMNACARSAQPASKFRVNRRTEKYGEKGWKFGIAHTNFVDVIFQSQIDLCVLDLVNIN